MITITGQRDVYIAAVKPQQLTKKEILISLNPWFLDTNMFDEDLCNLTVNQVKNLKKDILISFYNRVIEKYSNEGYRICWRSKDKSNYCLKSGIPQNVSNASLNSSLSSSTIEGGSYDWLK